MSRSRGCVTIDDSGVGINNGWFNIRKNVVKEKINKLGAVI